MNSHASCRLWRPTILVGAVLVSLLGFLGGCALTGAGSAAPPASQAVAQPPAMLGAQALAMPRSAPVSIDIPRIGASSSLVELGLNTDRTLQVPPLSQPMQAGWYKNGPTPGEPGPAVVLGHIDGDGQKGIFYRLGSLRSGDVVTIRRADGRTARFVVQRTEMVPKTNFPTEAVYGSTPDAELRVITCGGSLDRQAHSYRDNIIVFANLVPNQ